MNDASVEKDRSHQSPVLLLVDNVTTLLGPVFNLLTSTTTIQSKTKGEKCGRGASPTQMLMDHTADSRPEKQSHLSEP
jgi:hypothetical protein